MTSSWVKRIQRLESILQKSVSERAVFRYGGVRYLPQGSVGKRHIAIAKSEPTALANVQRCEFAERVGPALEACAELSFTVYLNPKEEACPKVPAESSKERNVMIISLKPPQSSVFTCNSRFRVLAAGRRFGKTFLACTELCRAAWGPGRVAW
jgi:hypothetical protein